LEAQLESVQRSLDKMVIDNNHANSLKVWPQLASLKLPCKKILTLAYLNSNVKDLILDHTQTWSVAEHTPQWWMNMKLRTVKLTTLLCWFYKSCSVICVHGLSITEPWTQGSDPMGIQRLSCLRLE
jgi:hypothetical protein